MFWVFFAKHLQKFTYCHFMCMGVSVRYQMQIRNMCSLNYAFGV